MCLYRAAEKCISLLFTLFLGTTLVLILFFEKGMDHYLKKDLGTDNIILFIAGVAAVALMTAVLGFIDRHCLKSFFANAGRKKVFLTIALLTLLLFILETVYVVNAFFYSDWDPAGVLDCVYKLHRNLGNEVSLDYFSAHPNNLMLVIIYSAVLKAAALFGTDSVLSLVIFQALIFALSGMILFFITYDLFSFRAAVYIWFFYAFWIGFNPYIIITYSDAVGVIIPLLTIRVFMCREKKGGRVLCPLLLGVLAGFGYSLKPQTLIPCIAAMLLIFLMMISKKEKGILRTGVIFAISLFFMLFIVSRVLYPSLRLELNKDKGFSLSHYLMMGLNPETDGVYSNEDTEFTNSIEDPDERKRENLRVAGERLKAYGPGGLAEHLIKKQMVNFSDGSFSWGIDGNFFAGPVLGDMPEVKAEGFIRSAIHSFITPEGAYYIRWLKVMQLLWILVITFAALSGARGILKERGAVLSAVMLSIIGLILFELLFEAKARYLFTFLPLFLISAGDGLFGFLSRKDIRQG